jgi:hypothetical protein
MAISDEKHCALLRDEAQQLQDAYDAVSLEEGDLSGVLGKWQETANRVKRTAAVDPPAEAGADEKWLARWSERQPDKWGQKAHLFVLQTPDNQASRY